MKGKESIGKNVFQLMIRHEYLKTSNWMLIIINGVAMQRNNSNFRNDIAIRGEIFLNGTTQSTFNKIKYNF